MQNPLLLEMTYVTEFRPPPEWMSTAQMPYHFTRCWTITKRQHTDLLNKLIYLYLRFKRFKNSSRVFAVDLMRPSMQLVTVLYPVFLTPLMTMQSWLDSITTATPCGWSTS